jgi:hypothetical protein
LFLDVLDPDPLVVQAQALGDGIPQVDAEPDPLVSLLDDERFKRFGGDAQAAGLNLVGAGGNPRYDRPCQQQPNNHQGG